MPSGQQVRELAQAAEKSFPGDLGRKALPQTTEPDRPQLSDDNPFAKLAREWEANPPRTASERAEAMKKVGMG
jgi:hypothetical protein